MAANEKLLSLSFLSMLEALKCLKDTFRYRPLTANESE